MKSKRHNINYVAWKSAEELHETSLNWISELKFIKDEQRFLDELIKNHTIQLISEKVFKKSSKIVNELDQKIKEVSPLLKKTIKHCNELTILVDAMDQPEKEKKYKEDHRRLLVEVSSYFDRYRQTKRKIFDLIKKIMKQRKQKRLLD